MMNKEPERKLVYVGGAMTCLSISGGGADDSFRKKELATPLLATKGEGMAKSLLTSKREKHTTYLSNMKEEIATRISATKTCVMAPILLTTKREQLAKHLPDTKRGVMATILQTIKRSG